MSWLSLVLALTVAVASASCAPRYAPVIAMSARSDDADLRLVALRPAPLRQFIFSARSERTHVIRRAWLTVPTRAPCAGGAQALDIAVDDHPPSDPTWPSGTHEIRARFEGSADGLLLNLVVDLQVDDGACARVPAISQSVPMAPVIHVVLVWTTMFDFNQNLSGERGAVGMLLGAGHWIGPVLASATAGISVALCDVDVCGREKNGDARSGWGVPINLEVRYHLDASRLGGLSILPLFGLRYTVMPVFGLPAFDGDRNLVVHGAHAVIGLGYNEMIKGPFQHFERGPLVELSMPIGVLFEPGASGTRTAFSAGLALRLLTPL